MAKRQELDSPKAGSKGDGLIDARESSLTSATSRLQPASFSPAMYLARRYNANILAWRPGSGDLKLPDGVQIKAHFNEFLGAFFKLCLSDSYYVRIDIHTARLVLIMIVGFLTMFKRVREGRLTLFCLQASTGGAIVIVPHSTNCLLLFKFFFGALWIAFEWIVVSIFHGHGMFQSIPSLPWRQQQPNFGRHYKTSDERRQALQFALATSKGTDLAGPEENAAAIKVWEYFKLAWWWGTVGFCEWTAFAWLTTLFQFIVGLVLAYELIVRMRGLDNQENDDDLIFSVPLTEPFPVEVDDEEDDLDFAARLSVPPPAELGDKQREFSSTDVSASKDGEGQTPDSNLCSTTRSPSLRVPVDRLGRPRRVQSSVV
ncbi:hypothetical protein FA10DRAFT_289677 [Acaromyces ingoldii]|uniref:Uncharacterized protein n=1 Tax=Acaromyces ingoldii TaxID=215250 RepID=A0A316YCU6_9BASI|nr:hypothetical protein FA10DRAFT_289677 [Acaromyces ingoldii]PWN86488.1 hypothetical protein FA10DRAFT_289677 [Acaromyces ingoldii]